MISIAEGSHDVVVQIGDNDLALDTGVTANKDAGVFRCRQLTRSVGSEEENLEDLVDPECSAVLLYFKTKADLDKIMGMLCCLREKITK